MQGLKINFWCLNDLMQGLKKFWQGLYDLMQGFWKGNWGIFKLVEVPQNDKAKAMLEATSKVEGEYSRNCVYHIFSEAGITPAF